VYREDVLNGGFFTATVGTYGSGPIPVTAPRASEENPPARPITYNGYVIADVTLGARQFTGAQVYLRLDADASTAVPFSDSTSSGYMNTGRGRVTIISNGSAVSASFAPGQIYVYYDVQNSSVGFGSYAGGRGYPLSITQNENSGMLEASLIGAVADIQRTSGADQANYTPATGTLVTDLTNPTLLSGGASSCVSFAVTSSVCSNLTPIPLATSQGNFTISEPYTDDEGGGPFSINWGSFWSENIPILED
jgi:hypothetical protein